VAEVDWSVLPVTEVATASCVYPVHDLDPAHYYPTGATKPSSGPIHVQRLVDGSLFVHDGRHRLIRAILAHQATIEARVFT
jgi:hypothetical protein